MTHDRGDAVRRRTLVAVSAIVGLLGLVATACSSPGASPGASSHHDRTADGALSSADIATGPTGHSVISGPPRSTDGATPQSRTTPTAATGTTRTATGTATGTDSSPALPHMTVAGTIATGITTPWGLGFVPDGTALVTERDTGKLLSISADQSHSVRTIGTVAGVQPGGEGGLLGLAVSPAFAQDHTIYVYLTTAEDNRVAAVTLNGSATRIEQQQAIVTGIPKAVFHNGGRLLIDPEGNLFIGTGDATDGSRAQDLGSLGGKILHVTGTGEPVAGHPFDDAPLVYSYGHRNVQGLAFDAQGQLWASEFGANAFDELNRIQPGKNYGWPVVEGPSDDSRFVAPYKYWPTSDASPSGLAIVGETAFMAALRGERLWLVPLSGGAGESTPVARLTGEYGRLRTVVVAPDGSVWLTTSNTDGRGQVRSGDDRILRLTLGSP